jgi:phage-related baseplate assembly protein
MTRFVAIDLASLPPINAVVLPDVEQIIADRKALLLARIPDARLRAEVAAVLRLESEPLVKQNEVGAYRELIVDQRVNEAVRAVLLATSRGADLDHLCARLNVVRLAGELDDELRYRYQLAPEAFSTAGPYGAYEYIARSAHARVKDAAIYGPESGLIEPGFVRVVILSKDGEGVPVPAIVDAVNGALYDGDTRPLTDYVEVRAAAVVHYAINYHLHIRMGADPSLIVREARDALTEYASACHKVGRPVVITALDSAAHQDRTNVIRAIKVAPLAEVDPGLMAAAWCTSVTVTYEIVEG